MARSPSGTPESAHLAIRLTPGASADRIDGWGVDAEGRPVLKVRVRARPIEGEANEALVKLMARTLGVPKSAVAIQRGGQSRTKILVIAGLSEDEAKACLTGL
ncbi:DUF167 domain-containing protein [Brevundimonas sp.]|uniref:DUF167 domain-containing protein n=1 Tax=Brevundimonas sp. TaxID=1871086 RepID=UPI00185AEE05|nr:DUF167 domain-containing protein [Brevundimonas sp.]MBA3050917.1 DUF167 domain-containing protein [Brevundimonas sp.]